MKNLTLVVILSLIASYLNAQESLFAFSEKQILIDGVNVNVVNSELIGNTDIVKSSWESYSKDKFEGKHKEKNSVYVTKQTVINKITDKRGDVIAYIHDIDDKVSFNFAYQLGYDVYVNSETFPIEFENQMDFVRHFVSDYYVEILPKMIKAKKKEIKKLQKEVKKSERTIRKTERKNKRIDRKTTNPKEKTDVKALNKTLDGNTAIINSKKSVLEDTYPKIETINIKIATYTITLEEAKSRNETY